MTHGLVVWITGLPSSGKSTLAHRLQDGLRELGLTSVLLDGDEVRAALVPRPGYGADERDHFYASLAGLAALLARQELVVIVAATAHRRAFRERARALAPRFLEVYLDIPPEECARRDAKGLYAQARQQPGSQLPGSGVDYEPPARPDFTLRTGHEAEVQQQLLTRIMDG